MQFFTGDIKKRDKILDYLYNKNIKFSYSEQYTFFKEYEYYGEKGINLTFDKSLVFMVEWNDKKVKKQHLMAL